MRYIDTIKNFFWLGEKLFGSRFIRFKSGPKNETDVLLGKHNFPPFNSKVNFLSMRACSTKLQSSWLGHMF